MYFVKLCGVALADGIEFVLFKMVATRTKMIVHN